MKILSCDFDVVWDRWDDPGDYPSNAGQSPLPSSDYVSELEGACVVELADEEMEEAKSIGLAWFESLYDCVYDEVPSGIVVVKWEAEFAEGNTVKVEVLEIDATDYVPLDEPD